MNRSHLPLLQQPVPLSCRFQMQRVLISYLFPGKEGIVSYFTYLALKSVSAENCQIILIMLTYNPLILIKIFLDMLSSVGWAFHLKA